MKSHQTNRSCRSNKVFYFVCILLCISLVSCQTKTQIAETTVVRTTIYTNTSTPSPRAPSITPSQTLTTSPTLTLTPIPPTSTPTPTKMPEFSFVVNADPANHAGPGEMDTQQFFRGMVESIANLSPVAFMITVGDTTPPWDTRWTIDKYLGEDFIWFPVLGNHELGVIDMDWLRNYNLDPNGNAPPNITSTGPPGCEETTYSFDYLNAHFVVLNVYCDLNNDTRTDGAIVDLLYDWLKKDLENTGQEHIFVFGHEPAFPQPDADAGIIRHLGDSLDQYPVTRDRFWDLLKDFDVTAYITGHTHSYSVVNIEGVWQVDVAHSMGARTQATRSTFFVIHVYGKQISYETFRVNNFTDAYELTHSGYLKN